MSKRVETVIVDLGNVVLKFDRGFEEISRLTGKPIDEVKGVFRKYDNEVCSGRLTVDEYWMYHLEGSTKKINKINFPRLWAMNFDPIVDMHNFLRCLAREKFKLGVLSNIPPDVFEYAEKFGSIPKINWFGIILSCNLLQVKPDKAIYQAAQKTMGVRDEQILFVDDRAENLHVPNELGWQTVLFDPEYPKRSIRKIRAKLKV